MKEESKLLAANPMSLSGQYDQRRGIITDLLHLLVTSEDPSYYIKSFEHLAAWVDNSLDQYKVLTWILLWVCSLSTAPCHHFVPHHNHMACCAPHRRCPCPCKGNMKSPGWCRIPLFVVWETDRADACGLFLQPELRRVLYPIFIHTFLDLMQKGATAEAMQLMNRFKRRFREDAAFPSKIQKQARPCRCRLMASLGLEAILCF